jgi:hypothetical protein
MPRRTINMSGEPALFDLFSYARRGPGRTDRLSPAQVEQVARTVRRAPEVMVKVSGGGTSAKGVVAHFKYLNRRPEFEIETDSGEHLQGRGSVNELVEDWDLELDAAEAKSGYSGRPGRKPVKLVHNIVLSMPAGTPAKGVLAASRAFAREQFALKNRYAMVLHTDQPHPHVHVVVKVMGEQGRRLNIRKATLREWRLEFARHLREQKINANATQRAVRGENKTPKRDGIYRAMRRGESTYMRNRVEAVARNLFAGGWWIDPGKATLLKTRKEIDRGWGAVCEILERQGQFDLADGARRFSRNMGPPLSDGEQLAAELIKRSRGARVYPTSTSR